MYDTKLAFEYLEIIQSAYSIGDIFAMKSNTFIPEGYRKMDPKLAEKIDITFSSYREYVPKHETFGTVIMLSFYEGLVKKAALPVFDKPVDFPVSGSLLTMELNSSLCVPNKNNSASFMLFDIGLPIAFDVLSKITTTLMTLYDFPNITFDVENLEDKRKLHKIITENSFVNSQFVYLMCSCLFPTLFFNKPSHCYSTKKEVEFHAQISSLSSFFVFAHEYTHYYLNHANSLERTILLNNVNIDIQKRDKIDEYAADYYSIILMENFPAKIDMSTPSCIGINQVFIFLHIMEGYKELLKINSYFETHPSATERLEHIKNEIKRNKFSAQFDMMHNFVGFSLFILNEYNKENVIEAICETIKRQEVGL